MNKNMSARGGSLPAGQAGALGGKKYLLAGLSIVFLAVACNQVPLVDVNLVPPPAQEKLSSLCTEKPIDLEIGSNALPIDEEYKHLPYLGQLFTANTCGPERVQESFWVRGEDYIAGSRLELKNNPSQELIRFLKSIGFSCNNNQTDSQCREWILSNTVKYKELLKLEPFTNDIESDDCVQCG